jgi:protein O-GlcNAc transferase
LNNLGSCYLIKLRSGDAIRCFEAAAEVWPTNPKPRNNVGAVLKELGLIDQAIPHFEKALQLDPCYADAYVNIGASYATVGEHRLSIAASREALRLQPDYAEVRSNLLLSLLSPTDISPEEIFAEHVAFDQMHARPLRRSEAPINIDVQSNRRLRVGYISADFREHSVRYFIEPILAAHDRSQFEIFCYASGRRRDEVTDRLATLVDCWQFVAELTNPQLADLIRANQIDILVDLAGHTSDHRLLTFAHKPAPVQVTYLGYPTTTGLSAMDYRLTDAITDPPGAEKFYTEKLVRLPHAFFVYTDDPAAWFDPALPAHRNGFFTFGSFNSFNKINDETLDAWANILLGVPHSRLLMKARPLENPSTRQRVVRTFAERGVSEDRLTLRAWVSLPEHTTMLGSAIDLMLDTFPYNGHTTSCQAIWRGVPVVTRAGDSFRSRVGECIMRNLDLPDFAARSKQEYEETAIRIASDLDRLRTLRGTLRDRMRASPLCDAVGFTRAIEQAYRQMLRENSILLREP